MGGGAGISMHSSYRIATENTVFAMPEGKIGFFTDVAGGKFLSELSDNIGYYLGLTSNSIKGKDVVRAGVATHYIPSSKIEEFVRTVQTELDNTECPSARSVIDEVIAKFSEPVEGDFPNVDIIREAFDDKNPVSIVHNLRSEGSEFSSKAFRAIKSNSPLSMRIIHE